VLPRGAVKQVLDVYCGSSEAATETLRKLAGAVFKLSDNVFSVIGDIFNGEFPALARSQYLQQHPKANLLPNAIGTEILRGKGNWNTMDVVLDHRVYRVYRDVLHSRRYRFRSVQWNNDDCYRCNCHWTVVHST